MPPPHILIVAVDGLRTSALGAYGNTIFPTPALDQFAAESFVLDACYAPSADLAEVYRALWQSVYPALPKNDDEAVASLPRFLSQRDYSTTLIADAPEISSLPIASHFRQNVQLAKASDIDIARAHDVSGTSLASLFAAACEVIGAVPSASPSMLWVHARGMYGPWDAPIDLQRSLLDEDDPPPVESISPPDLSVGDRDDPDAAFRYACAYAAQIMVLDACWNGLRETIRSADPNNEWIVMLIGTHGFPLGEHRRIGGIDPRLYAEQLHVPWLVRLPGRRGRLARSMRLTSPLDLLPTLLECADGDDRSQMMACDGLSVIPLVTATNSAWRENLFAASARRHRAVRTAEWSLRRETGNERAELFVRPDDRWESNDVAKLCPEVVERLVRLAIES